MSISASAAPSSDLAAPVAAIGDRTILVLWLLSGLLLLAGLGVNPVSRTQEARVLETAREMVGATTHQWLIPRVNGHVRLRKPPLAYWLAAGSYKIFGVSEGAGRVPFALAGWLAVGLTYATGRRFFNRTVAFAGAAALLGSRMFFHHTRLAETDALVLLFCTAAVYSLWRGYVAWDALPATSGGAFINRFHPIGWWHAAAAAMGLAALSKGPPAFYPLLFFVALAGVERRWKTLASWVASGAPLTLIIVAAPWFVYAALDPQFRQIMDDLRNSAGGGKGHSGWFYEYVPDLLVATAPWSGFVVAAVIFAIGRRRDDRSIRALLLWAAAIMLPLCVWGNKQPHYLMPLLPPLALLVGWLIDRALSPSDEAGFAPIIRWIYGATLAIGLLAGPAVVAVARHERGRAILTDAAVAVGLSGVSLLVWIIWRRRGLRNSLVLFQTLAPLILLVSVELWFPLVRTVNARSMAQTLKVEFGAGPYCFYGHESLPFVYNLRSLTPVARNSAELTTLMEKLPGAVVIEYPLKQRLDPDAFGLTPKMRFRTPDGVIQIYADRRRSADAGRNIAPSTSFSSDKAAEDPDGLEDER